ncbi:MAG: hypothetical protein C0623_11115 [Desulfuromonas sp.]|nr:MAG: hypothetical protein C0623_11115 [Desulfuromonas sp.]
MRQTQHVSVAVAVGLRFSERGAKGRPQEHRGWVKIINGFPIGVEKLHGDTTRITEVSPVESIFNISTALPGPYMRPPSKRILIRRSGNASDCRIKICAVREPDHQAGDTGELELCFHGAIEKVWRYLGAHHLFPIKRDEPYIRGIKST